MQLAQKKKLSCRNCKSSKISKLCTEFKWGSELCSESRMKVSGSWIHGGKNLQVLNFGRVESKSILSHPDPPPPQVPNTGQNFMNIFKAVIIEPYGTMQSKDIGVDCSCPQPTSIDSKGWRRTIVKQWPPLSNPKAGP